MNYIWDIELCIDLKIVDDELRINKFIIKNKRIIVQQNNDALFYVKPILQFRNPTIIFFWKSIIN